MGDEYRSNPSDGLIEEQADVEVFEVEDPGEEQLGFRETKDEGEYLKSITEEGTIYTDEGRRDSLI